MLQKNWQLKDSKFPIAFCLILIFSLQITELVPYHCSLSPVLLATSVQQFNYKMPYDDYFGGVTAISLEHYLAVNGYPNRSDYPLILQ